MKRNKSKKTRGTRSRGAERMRAEYDFSAGVRGKYAAGMAEGSNLVVLAPDVARSFPDSASVNSALRALVALAKRQVQPQRRKG
jgi:hypothetical protein